MEAHEPRLLLILAASLSLACTKTQDEVKRDVRAAISEVESLEAPECEAAKMIADGVLDGRGYRQAGDGFKARGVNTTTVIDGPYLYVQATTPSGHILALDRAACNP